MAPAANAARVNRRAGPRTCATTIVGGLLALLAGCVDSRPPDFAPSTGAVQPAPAPSGGSTSSRTVRFESDWRRPRWALPTEPVLDRPPRPLLSSSREHTSASYRAAAVLGAGRLECDVTFTKDRVLVCRHAQCDLATTTNILSTPLADRCRVPLRARDERDAGTGDLLHARLHVRRAPDARSAHGRGEPPGHASGGIRIVDPRYADRPLRDGRANSLPRGESRPRPRARERRDARAEGAGGGDALRGRLRPHRLRRPTRRGGPRRGRPAVARPPAELRPGGDPPLDPDGARLRRAGRLARRRAPGERGLRRSLPRRALR